jgi:hypothetical protein
MRRVAPILAVAALALLLLAPAAAQAKVDDGTYEGDFKRDQEASVTVEVRDDGETVDVFFEDVLFRCRDGSKTREDITVTGIGIRNREFFIKTSNKLDVSGVFEGDDKVKGSLSVKVDNCRNHKTEWKARRV